MPNEIANFQQMNIAEYLSRSFHKTQTHIEIKSLKEHKDLGIFG